MVLIALAAVIPWRHRGEGTWRSRAVAVPAGVLAVAVLAPIAMGIGSTHKWREPVGSPPGAAYQEVAFEASDGGKFTVSAMYNINDDTLAQVEESYLSDREAGEKITYRDKGSNWFVLSGTRGDTIFYERHLLSHRNELINSFDIAYPARLRSVYDPIVTRMSKSLHAGVGADGEKP